MKIKIFNYIRFEIKCLMLKNLNNKYIEGIPFITYMHQLCLKMHNDNLEVSLPRYWFLEQINDNKQ